MTTASLLACKHAPDHVILEKPQGTLRLQQTNATILRGPSTYYACLGLKRQGTWSTEERKGRAAEAYETSVVDAWMARLLEHADFRLPPCITKPRSRLADLPFEVGTHVLTQTYPNATARHDVPIYGSGPAQTLR